MTDSLLEERVSELEEVNRELQSTIEEFKDEIADRRRAGQELQESEKRYRALIEGLNEAVYRMSLPDGRYVYFSSAVKLVFGYNAKDFLDNPRFIKKIIHPDSRKYFKREWAKLIKGKVPPTYEYKIIDPEGGERWIIQSNKGVFDDEGNIIALEGICRDITERRKAVEALRESEERFRAVFETAQDFIFIKDRSLRYTQLNPAMEKLFDLPASEIIGRTDDDLFDGEAAAHIREVDSRVLGGETAEEEHTKNVNGVLFTFHVVKVPIRDESGEITGLCGIARDITNFKKAEKKLREKMDELEVFNKLMIGRELKMIELKKEIRKLKEQLNKK